MRSDTAKSSVRMLFGAALALALAATASAQSLGDMAKKEAERRKAIKSPGKVLTGDSIRSVPAPSPASVPSPAPAAGGAATGSAATEKPKPEVDRKAQELAWRQRIQAARDSLQRSQTFAEALQSRINGLTTDFTARDDPAQRAVVANDRQKALAELDRVKNDIVQQTKAIADIQEEARRAGVPPGWLR
ncbi:MAG TPA: hypothetical protein VFO21_02420 [Vicinamibacterales bacterium]|nr:hypothetical protein [Vicinamibacterales bacterium]